MNDLQRAAQQALDALEAMMAEFKALDLPYGSKAYALAKDARLDLHAALAESVEKSVLLFDGMTPQEFVGNELYKFQEATGCDTAEEYIAMTEPTGKECLPVELVQDTVCDKDPQECWSVRCQLGKVCKNTIKPTLTDGEYWQEEARRYAGNADYWRSKCEAMEQTRQKPVVWIQSDHLQKASKEPFMCRVDPIQRHPDFVPLYVSAFQHKLLKEDGFCSCCGAPNGTPCDNSCVWS